MKPNSTNNLSVFGIIGLIILFNIPDIGLIAMVLFAIFGRCTAKKLARAFLIIDVLIILVAVVIVLIGFGGFDFKQLFPELIPNIGDFEVFRNVSNFIG
jgi:hypothetical protein